MRVTEELGGLEGEGGLEGLGGGVGPALEVRMAGMEGGMLAAWDTVWVSEGPPLVLGVGLAQGHTLGAWERVTVTLPLLVSVVLWEREMEGEPLGQGTEEGELKGLAQGEGVVVGDLEGVPPPPPPPPLPLEAKEAEGVTLLVLDTRGELEGETEEVGVLPRDPLLPPVPLPLGHRVPLVVRDRVRHPDDVREVHGLLDTLAVRLPATPPTPVLRVGLVLPLLLAVGHWDRVESVLMEPLAENVELREGRVEADGEFVKVGGAGVLVNVPPPPNLCRLIEGV